MNGSEKQIKWAESIKGGMNFSNLRNAAKSPIAIKAVDFVESNESATFWIDNRNETPETLVRALLGAGLSVNGKNSSKTARMDATGKITVRWEEIVQDGKGGHKETKTVEL